MTSSEAAAYQRRHLTLSGDVFRGWTNWAVNVELLGGDRSATAGVITLDHVEVLDCELGVGYLGGSSDRFSMHHTHVSARRVGLALTGGPAADLGTAASPGDNQVEVTSGDVALNVSGRLGDAVDAHGTMLNGMSFQGDVQGPADVPGAYRISDPVVIHF